MAAGADRPLLRDPFVAAHVHGQTGLDGPRAAPAGGSAARRPCGRFPQPSTREGRPWSPSGRSRTWRCCWRCGPPPAPDRVVLMGGAIAEGNITPAAEFNIWADPEAAERVFASGLDVTMVGLDVTHKALLRPEHAERSARSRTGGEARRGAVRLLPPLPPRDLRPAGGSPVHDALALAQVLEPDLLEVRRLHVAVDCESQLCRGRTVVDVWGRTPGTSRTRTSPWAWTGDRASCACSSSASLLAGI